MYLVRSYKLLTFFCIDTTQVLSLTNIIIALSFPMRVSTFFDLQVAASDSSNYPEILSTCRRLTQASYGPLARGSSQMGHVTDISFIELQIIPYAARHPRLPCRPPHPWMRVPHRRLPNDHLYRISTHSPPHSTQCCCCTLRPNGKLPNLLSASLYPL